MKTLYKFVGSKGAVQAIASGSLKFTKIEELNDPSELVPIMNRDAVRDSLASIRKTGYSEAQFEWLGCQDATLRLLSPETRILSRPASVELANKTLALAVYDNLDFMERQVLQTIKLIRSRVGVLSLTERFDSLPMWAHYGAQAKGYVLRFNDLDQEFPGDATGSLNAVKPVRYVEDLLGLTHDPSTQDNLFFCKFRDWSYEREWRVVSALSSCQTSHDGKMHLRSIGRSKVTGVICGWNVPENDVRLLVSEVQDINPGVEVLIASLSRGRIVLSSWAR
jgi:hypothetical protein